MYVFCICYLFICIHYTQNLSPVHNRRQMHKYRFLHLIWEKRAGILLPPPSHIKVYLKNLYIQYSHPWQIIYQTLQEAIIFLWQNQYCQTLKTWMIYHYIRGKLYQYRHHTSFIRNLTKWKRLNLSVPWGWYQSCNIWNKLLWILWIFVVTQWFWSPLLPWSGDRFPEVRNLRKVWEHWHITFILTPVNNWKLWTSSKLSRLLEWWMWELGWVSRSIFSFFRMGWFCFWEFMEILL